MRQCPLRCEWFRGCPNEALIYYNFSDKWLCEYCIGYARIGLVRCAQDGTRKGICVDVDTQSWFCGSHARQCEANIERPDTCHFGGTHRCPRRAITADSEENWWCAIHKPMESETTPSDDQRAVVFELPVPLAEPRRSTGLPQIVEVAMPETPVIPMSDPLFDSHTPIRWLHFCSNVWSQVTPSTMLRAIPRTRVLVNDLIVSPTSTIIAHTLHTAARRMSLSSAEMSHETTSPALPRQRHPPMADYDTESLDVFSTEVHTVCCICLDVHRSMRRLKSCGHKFCENCLLKQIRSSGAWRDNCALCRRHLYHAIDTEDITF